MGGGGNNAQAAAPAPAPRVFQQGQQRAVLSPTAVALGRVNSAAPLLKGQELFKACDEFLQLFDLEHTKQHSGQLDYGPAIIWVTGRYLGCYQHASEPGTGSKQTTAAGYAACWKLIQLYCGSARQAGYSTSQQ